MASYYRIPGLCRLPGNSPISARISTTLSTILAASAFLTVITFYLGAKGQVNAFPTYLGGLAFLALAFLPGQSLAGQWRWTLQNRILLLTLVFTFYLALTTAWSPAATPDTTALYIGFAVLQLGFVVGLVWVLRRWPSLVEGLLSVCILAAAVSAVYSLYFFYGLDYHPLVEKDRLYALGRLANPVIGALGYGAALVYAANRMMWRKDYGERAFWGLLALLLVYTVVMTGTRSVWVGFAGAVMALLVCSHRLSLRARIGLVVVAVIVATGALGFALHSPLRAEILRRSTSFRPEIWSDTLSHIHGLAWLVGNGINTASSVQDSGFVFEHPHSIYLATLFYGGALGLVQLLALLGLCFYRLIRLPESELRNAALAALTFAATSLLFDGDYLMEKVDYFWIVFWLPIALAAWLSARGRQHA